MPTVRGGYYALGGDAGKIIGCTDVTPGHLTGRYLSDNSAHTAGSFDITIDALSPLAFTGTYTPDGGSATAWTGTFLKHFGGDGANPEPLGCRKTQSVGARGSCQIELWTGTWYVTRLTSNGKAQGTITLSENTTQIEYVPARRLLPKFLWASATAHGVSGSLTIKCDSGKGEIIAFAEKGAYTLTLGFVSHPNFDTLYGDYYCAATGSAPPEYGTFTAAFTDSTHDKWSGTFTPDNRSKSSAITLAASKTP